MSDLTEFLVARVAEDEMAASAQTQAPWLPAARVLAECEAKRRIVAAHHRQVEDDDPRAWIVASEVILRTLAAVYREHPGYRTEWES